MMKKGVKLLSLLLSLCLMIGGIAVLSVLPASASTQRLTMQVGEKRYLECTDSSGKAVQSWAWLSNNQNVISILSSANSYMCQIQAIAPSSGSSPVVVQCRYNYLEVNPYSGAYMLRTEAQDYYITVAAPKEATSVSISTGSITIDERSSYKLNATLSPSGSVGTCRWSSSDTNVATVNTDGRVWGVSEGTATIRVALLNSAGNQIDSASCTVTVRHAHSVSTGYSSDDDAHWQTCTGCGATMNQNSHQYPEGKIECLACGHYKYVFADVDGDKEVTMTDARYLLWHTFLPARYPVDQPIDFNGDGGVNSFDATHLSSHLSSPADFPLMGCVHILKQDALVPATCEESGLTAGEHCVGCGMVTIPQETIPATGHEEVIDPAVPVTCTETGKTEGKHCSTCKKILVAQDSIPTTGHTEATATYQPATCEEDGHTAGKYCTVCDYAISGYENIPATGHAYGEDRICTSCKSEMPATLGLAYESINGGTAWRVIGMGDADVTDLVIPYYHENLPVTEIGESAFESCTTLKSIRLSAYVTKIGRSAFFKCSSLSTIHFEEGLTHIDPFAFGQCGKLERIDLPDSVETLAYFAFDGCTALKYVRVPSTIKKCMGAFSDCTSLRYEVYDNVCYLGNEVDPYVVLMKNNDDTRTEVEIHEKTRIIDKDAFWGAVNLKQVTIPDSVIVIGDGAFCRCEKLESVSFGKNLEDIEAMAFVFCTNLTSVVIPASVKRVYTSIFRDCSRLTSVVFEDTQGWECPGLGTKINVSSPTQNAANMISKYSYEWIKNPST